MAPKNNEIRYFSNPWRSGQDVIGCDYRDDSSGEMTYASYLLFSSKTPNSPASQRFLFHDVEEEKGEYTCRLQFSGSHYDKYWLDVSGDYLRPYGSSSCRWRFVDKGDYVEWRVHASGRIVTMKYHSSLFVAKSRKQDGLCSSSYLTVSDAIDTSNPSAAKFQARA
ncbi:MULTISPECIES: hypothetical protein [unclassified Streptomyces]|uniref:hypothetical protein n=1 Tax=unclassified Streptomyces TaxID=2593676 RepID=UPI000DC78441|nr:MULTISPECIES: hypothetical protein [unclassified Streptomyces]AWZ05247.1 hypothetical protein DRB89_11925 [Streptomyces sp. ICC4]AWZ12730.1 hypothetical protein DRB96_10790 [Streptomyces sp. ICC1]